MPPLLALLVSGLAFAAFDDASALDAALIAGHNRERAAKGLPPLVAEPRLAEAARLHAADMAAHETMSHDGSDGSKPADRVKARGYPYVSTGENVAAGQTTVDRVMTDWMNSPHHRDNILGDYTEIGVARVDAKDGRPYWCVEFGRPFPRLDPSKAEAELASRLDDARTSADKPALHVDPKLSAAARAIAADLAAKPDDGKASFEARLKESGYAYATVAESVASGTPTAESVVDSLLKSADRKATILGDYSDVGVGYALGPDGRPTWCVLLAKPRG